MGTRDIARSLKEMKEGILGALSTIDDGVLQGSESD